MPTMNFFKRQAVVAPATNEFKSSSRLLVITRAEDSSVSTSTTSTRTENTVQSDFSDETRQDFHRSPSDLAFSDDEDGDDFYFLSPQSAISKGLKGQPEAKAPLSPVPSYDDDESQRQPSSPESPAASLSESQHPHVKQTSTSTVSSNHVQQPEAPRHNRHRSMTAVAALESTPPRGHRRSNTLSPSGARPPTHRRSASMNSQNMPPRSPVAAPLSLESLHATRDMRMQRFGAQHYSVGQTWNLIGNHHFRQQQYEKAIGAYEKALTCDQGCVEPRDSDHITAAFGNIGTVCWSTGDLERAVTCFERALELRMTSEVSQGVEPESSLVIAASRHQLGLALSLTKEYAKALEQLKCALCIREKVLGRKSNEVARTLDAIGKVYMFCGNPDDALRCHQKSYETKIALSAGERSPAVIASLTMIAAAQMARKDFKEAIFAYLGVRSAQSLELQRATKEASPSLARLAQAAGETSQILVDLYSKTKSYENARLFTDEALQLYQQAGLKEDHPRMQALKNAVKALEKAALNES